MRPGWYNRRAVDQRSGPNSRPRTPYAIFLWLFGPPRVPVFFPKYASRAWLFGPGPNMRRACGYLNFI
jgi:hypothetical protein